MNKNITILEDYKNSKNNTIEDNSSKEENTILVWTCTNCGNDTYNVQLTPRDPETGEREIYLVCTECKIESYDFLDYV